MPAISKPLLNRFRRDERGAIAVLFGITFFVALAAAGGALDYGRAVTVHTKMRSALDAATLAGAQALRSGDMTDSEVIALTEAFYFENMKSVSGGEAGSVSVTLDHENFGVEATAQAQVQTAFLKAFGRENFEVATTVAAVFDSKDIELGISLDVTGSMCPGGDCSKLDALKEATTNLVDTMFPKKPLPGKVRIGLAPFSAGVNAGEYSDKVSNGKSVNGCVYERQNGNAHDDKAPIADIARMSAAGDAGIKPSAKTPCPTKSPVLALTNNAQLLKDTVTAYQAEGSTAGHLGTAWAWYLVSPQWNNIWPESSTPAAYNPKKTIKAVILMTDGAYNTLGGVNGGDVSFNASKSQDHARKLCKSMRDDASIIVYTVGFQLDNAASESVLKDCAADPTRFYSVETADQLKGAFKDIAVKLQGVRLKK